MNGPNTPKGEGLGHLRPDRKYPCTTRLEGRNPTHRELSIPAPRVSKKVTHRNDCKQTQRSWTLDATREERCSIAAAGWKEQMMKGFQPFPKVTDTSNTKQPEGIFAKGNAQRRSYTSCIRRDNLAHTPRLAPEGTSEDARAESVHMKPCDTNVSSDAMCARHF